MIPDQVLSICYGTFPDNVNRVTVAVYFEGEVWCVVYNEDCSFDHVYTGAFMRETTFPPDVLEIAEIPMRDYIAGYV